MRRSLLQKDRRRLLDLPRKAAHRLLAVAEDEKRSAVREGLRGRKCALSSSDVFVRGVVTTSVAVILCSLSPLPLISYFAGRPLKTDMRLLC